MENYVGKICPFCKTEIKEGDSVIVCPACSIPHHKHCWEENKGCTTSGCSEQHCEAQQTSPANVCQTCGAPLGDEQAFCSKCGQKVGAAADAGAVSAMNQFNANAPKTNPTKKTLLFAAIAIVAVVAIVVIALLVGGSRANFNKMFGAYATQSWCEISDDGTYMKIDTNPLDLTDELDLLAYHSIEKINDELGFSPQLFEIMGETTALDGRQSDENEKYSVSWKYHPDSGLEVSYEVKK